jgi:hypothetical protein
MRAAVHAALQTLATVAAGLAWFLIVLGPWLLLAGLGWALVARVRRRASSV